MRYARSYRCTGPLKKYDARRATMDGSPPVFWRRSMTSPSEFARKAMAPRHYGAATFGVYEAIQLQVADVACEPFHTLEFVIADPQLSQHASARRRCLPRLRHRELRKCLRTVNEAEMLVVREVEHL